MPKRTRSRIGRRRAPLRKRPFRARRALSGRRGRAATARMTVAPISDRCFTKMHWHGDFIMQTAAAPNTNARILRMNSINDPLNTGTITNQPYGHDELAYLWSRYRVMSCGYRIRFKNNNGTYNIAVGILPKGTTTLTPAWRAIAEKPYSKTRMLSKSNDDGAVTVMKGKIYPAKILGVSNERYRVDDLYASTGMNSDPAASATLQLYVHDALTNFPGLDVVVTVDLYYHVVLFDRVQLTSS